ncbi:protein PilX [Luteimonas sp. BDR2-5]|uniref:pilus assembly PilX family protein n=1 Tax=Proluteimonas luteida TaxID=2878685 RepID=UPI001E2C25F7|nr:PilX N-terminal domain-containing pilus assembly protein [Luteimonas sp. BDR2-5]MCD9029782.1 protein PilX [Luteimonas sp. BDR2-5]
MNMRPLCRNPSFRREKGAALYVALIMLILLALIGIVGMQVATLQERMASNYRAVNIAFQNAESSARDVEESIRSTLSASGTFAADREDCVTSFDPLTWADDLTSNASGTTYTRRVDRCFTSSSLRIGERLNEETGNIYEVSALGSDGDSDNAATAVINTIFIP